MPWVFALMGLAAVNMGQDEEGLGFLEKSAALDEETGFFAVGLRAPLLKARILTRLGRVEEAEELYGQLFLKANQFDPRYRLLTYFEGLSDLYYWQGRLQEARETLEYWHAASRPFVEERGGIPSDRILNLARLASLCTQLGDLDAAAEYVREAEAGSSEVSSEEGAAFATFARATLQAARGEVDDAASRFREAVGFSPSLAYDTMHRSRILLEYGKFLAANSRTAEAREVLREAQQTSQVRHQPMEEAIETALAAID